MANDKPQTRAELKQAAAEVGDTRVLTPAEIEKSARDAELAAKEAVAVAEKAMLASGRPAAERAYAAAGYGTLKDSTAAVAPKPSVKPSPTFMASMESTLASLDKDPKPATPKPLRRAAVAPHGDPESLLPAGFDEPVKAATRKPAAPRDEVGELIDKYVTNQPVVTSQDHVAQGLARVTDSRLTQVQRTEAFINELASNRHFAARFGVSANSAGKLDLDGDRQVEPREYEAVANQLWKDARFKSIEKIAETLGNDKQIAEAARQFGGSMEDSKQVALRIIPQGDPDKGGHHR